MILLAPIATLTVVVAVVGYHNRPSVAKMARTELGAVAKLVLPLWLTSPLLSENGALKKVPKLKQIIIRWKKRNATSTNWPIRVDVLDEDMAWRRKQQRWKFYTDASQELRFGGSQP